MTTAPSPLRYFGILPESREARLLRYLLETAVEAIRGDEGSLLIHDREAGDLRWAMTVGDPESERKLLGQRLGIGQGITGLAAATHEVQVGAPIYHDIEQTKRRGSEPEAVVAAPMVSGEALIGVITVVSFETGRRFGAAEAKLAGRLATIAAVLVEQYQRISAPAGRSAISAGGTDPEINAKLREIDAALQRIVEQHPEAVAQVAAIVGSLESALHKPTR
jgi:GAF domain-containing protein